MASTSAMPLASGGPSGSPFVAIIPLKPCTMKSYAVLARSGPVCPKPDTDTMISRSFTAARSS